MNTEFRVGQATNIERTFTQADFDRFAALSGDDNPIHTDPGFSARTKFGKTVAHGMLLYSAVCGVLGSRLPGHGTRQLVQELKFPSATPAEVAVTVKVEIIGVDGKGEQADLTTTIAKPDGSAGLEGRTVVLLPRMPGWQLGTAARQPEMERGGAPFKGLQVGQTARTRRAFSEKDLADYAALAHDDNPLLVDASFARQLGLPGVLVPGPLIGGLFSFLLGTRLPGRGANYLKQRLEFLAPATAGQELEAIVEIVRLRPDKQLVNLATLCASPSRVGRGTGGRSDGPDNQVVCRGEALVMVSDLETA